KVTCPVLAINGSEDVQVSPRNLPLIANALAEGGNEQVTIKEFSGMNHLFQTCKTCSMSEYDNIEQTITPEVMEEISDWIWETIR
ncbi:MAG: alpha/beta hydrolase, partial [Bacteroidetes bacterium]|nr:alpha/beta hydrolase [Bacteroidota bacterium]